MSKLEHWGYTARVEFDEVDRVFVGHLVGIKDIVGFHGKTVDELEAAFEESVEEYIAINKFPSQHCTSNWRAPRLSQTGCR